MSDTYKTVKNRDQYPITVTASEDLGGSTVRLLYRERYSRAEGAELAVTDATPTGREVTHLLDGTLSDNGADDGQEYELELEAVWPGSPPTRVTFPTDQNGKPQFLVIRVVPDIA